jgi:hypothetical protein
LAQSAKRRDLAGHTPNKSFDVSRRDSRSGLVFSFYYQEVFLPAIDGDQVSDDLPRYSHVARFALPSVSPDHRTGPGPRCCAEPSWPLRSARTVFVPLLGERRALNCVRRPPLRPAQPAIADRFLPLGALASPAVTQLHACPMGDAEIQEAAAPFFGKPSSGSGVSLSGIHGSLLTGSLVSRVALHWEPYGLRGLRPVLRERGTCNSPAPLTRPVVPTWDKFQRPADASSDNPNAIVTVRSACTGVATVHVQVSFRFNSL